MHEYDDLNRGSIQNREAKRQIIDFHGMRYSNITPTDLDGIIEYKNLGYIFYEYKFKKARLPDGQYLCLTRLVDDLCESGKMAVLLICEHNISYRDGDVNAANAIVREVYYKGKTFDCYKGQTAKEVSDKIIRHLQRRG